MAIQLVNYAGSTSVTVDSCQVANWTINGTGNTPVLSSGGQEIPPREGTDCLDYGLATGWNGAKSAAYTPTINIEQNEIGVWFLLPAGDDSVSQFLGDYESPGVGRHSLTLRLYAGTNWAEFDQGSDDTLPHGWIYLRASGAAGTEDRNSGVWGATQAQAVNYVEVRCYNANANNGTSKSETVHYAVDWVKAYRDIKLTTIATYDLDDIFAESNSNNWGVVEKSNIFYRIKAGIIAGDATTAGTLSDENKFIYFDQYQSIVTSTKISGVDFGLIVANAYTVELGAKVPGTGVDYAVNGIPIVAKAGRPPLTVQSGGIFKYYAGKLEGFGTVNFGSGGSGVIELIKVDMFDNTTVEFRSSNLDITDTRFHFPDGDEAAIGKIYSVSDVDRIRVFQVTDGLEVRVACDIKAMRVGDAVTHLKILNNITCNLINSEFDDTKLGYVAA